MKKSLGMKRSHSTITSNRRESTFMHIAFSIKAIADDVEREFKAKGVNIKFSERALTRVGQIVSNQLENQYARDLYTYAKHAGRSIPTIDDVKLLYHRNPEIKRRVDELANLSSDVLPFSRKKSVEFDHQTLNEAVFPTEKSTAETTPHRLAHLKPTKKTSLLHPKDDPRPGPHIKTKTDDFYNDDDFGIWAEQLKNAAEPETNILEDRPTSSRTTNLITPVKVTTDLRLDVTVHDWFQPDSHSTPLNATSSVKRKKVDDLITTLDENVKTPLTRKNIPPDDSFYNDEDDLAWAQIIQNRC